ncbi:SGNH hydrolase [Microthyrium microscopicum]|uniref:SGNH hydrolase n=1 Tax=Microthyrium microscopicum TaxID=703497 RepID=A0A6A6U288_9PEZI|nr:SGNH hydrolase [Microthyrium microscopicum]
MLFYTGFIFLATWQLFTSIPTILCDRIRVQYPFKSDTSLDSGRRLRYVAFGDSWASGVNWGPPSENTEFDFPDDQKVCQCRRMREAYPAQLLDDPDRSYIGGRDLELTFLACHGAQFEDVPHQLQALDPTIVPDFATLMIGGNPAGFAEILADCIFLPDRDRDYGPEYPDPDGECWKTLERVRTKLESTWFHLELFKTLNAIQNERRMWLNPNFRLYVLSYSGLFNHDDPACNDWTFGIWPGKKPLLTTELRHAINNVLDHGRKVYDNLINHVLYSPKVQYIDLNHVFAGHRFCEPTEASTFEAQMDNSWLYGLTWPDCIPLEYSFVHYANDNDGRQQSRAWQFCRNCGGLGELGELQRVMHPNGQGHEAYKNALKEIIRRDFGKVQPDVFAVRHQKYLY